MAAADQHTDAGQVILGISAAALRAVDEDPHRSAIVAGVKLVMTSWAVYPTLDPRLPAGLSPVVIGHELRGRLRVRGVTITDAITAGALRGFGSLGACGVLAARGRAGADLIRYTAPTPDQNTPALGLVVLHAITAALEHGRLPRSGAERAVARELALRAELEGAALGTS